MNHSAYKSHTQTCIIIVFSFHCLGYWLIDKYKDVKYVSIYDTIYHLRFGYMVICHNCSLLLVLKVTVFYSKRCHLFSKLNRLHLVQYLSSPTHSLISTLLMIICQKHHPYNIVRHQRERTGQTIVMLVRLLVLAFMVKSNVKHFFWWPWTFSFHNKQVK